MAISAEHMAELRCPLCLTVGTRSIQCEGLTDRSTLTQRFSTLEEYRIQMEGFCCGRYQNCELYRAVLQAKYADALEAGL